MDERKDRLEVDATPAGEQILLFSRCVLEAVPATSSDVLSQSRVAKAVSSGQEGGRVL